MQAHLVSMVIDKQFAIFTIPPSSIEMYASDHEQQPRHRPLSSSSLVSFQQLHMHAQQTACSHD